MTVLDIDTGRNVAMGVAASSTDEREEATGATAGRATELARPAAHGRGDDDADDAEYALFEHAIARRDDAAWATVYARYGDLVRHWLGPGWDNADEGVAAVFVRFWHAMDAEKLARFTSVAPVLRYLKLCAQTTRLDHVRAIRNYREEPLDDVAHAMAAPGILEETVLSQSDRLAFWRAVQACLTDRREREVIYLSYVQGLCPRQISARHNARFPCVQDVYRLKRAALNRLRHAPASQFLLALGS